MSTLSLRRVVEPTPPPMTESEFQTQLIRHTVSLDQLEAPEKTRKNSHYPDLARAAAAVHSAFRVAHAAAGSNNDATYHHALVSVRRAVATWLATDARHGEVTWRPPAS